MRNHAVHSAPSARPETIRRYSMTWLLRAACRIHQRGIELQGEHNARRQARGLAGLFDLSDTWRRMGS